MAISQAQFDALVARLEEEAARQPTTYKLKLATFASLGYLYVAAVLLALIVASGALIAALIFSKGLFLLIKKAVIPLVLIGVVLKSLWVKLEPPQGTRLARRDHPGVFKAIDEVRRAARAPRAPVVLLTNDVNAAIVQVPRVGLFGWQRNYLILRGREGRRLRSVVDFGVDGRPVPLAQLARLQIQPHERPRRTGRESGPLGRPTDISSGRRRSNAELAAAAVDELPDG